MTTDVAGLTKLDGGDTHPQGYTAVLATSGVTPSVEVTVLDPGIVEVTGGEAPIVEVAEGGPSAIVHVVEPVVLEAQRLGLDDLTDVDTEGAVPAVAYALRRATADDPWELVPTVDAEGLLLRVEAGAPGGIAQLGDDGRLRASQRPAVAWTHAQVLPALLWQVNHGLGFDPAGVTVVDGDGVMLEPERITHPIPGATTEIVFGLPVYGTARLS